MSDLLPCPFCGNSVELTETFMRTSPSMGTQKPRQLLSVSVVHHCPRKTDELRTYAVLQHFIEVRGRDHKSAAEAWNKRAQ